MQVIVHPAEKLLALLKLYRCTHTSLDMHKKIRKRKKKSERQRCSARCGNQSDNFKQHHQNCHRMTSATDSNNTAIQKENFENKGFPFMTLSI
jgi:hypothetical protein